ncbi:hypothetical protein oki361_24730 [Helicobacter pylori]
MYKLTFSLIDLNFAIFEANLEILSSLITFPTFWFLKKTSLLSTKIMSSNFQASLTKFSFSISKLFIKALYAITL